MVACCTSLRAGDRTRTGTESLEGSCATVTPRPRGRNRGDWIRTSDRSAPSRVRYQTAPRPVTGILARDDRHVAADLHPYDADRLQRHAARLPRAGSVARIVVRRALSPIFLIRGGLLGLRVDRVLRLGRRGRVGFGCRGVALHGTPHTRADRGECTRGDRGDDA